MSRILYCVYGFNLTLDGELGSGTIRRLRRALSCYQKTGGAILVAATTSPYHGHLPCLKPMGLLMGRWLEMSGVPSSDIIFREALSFDTDGEAQVFSAELRISSREIP